MGPYVPKKNDPCSHIQEATQQERFKDMFLPSKRGAGVEKSHNFVLRGQGSRNWEWHALMHGDHA